MENNHINFQLEHWPAILLATIPALLNLVIFIYVRVKFSGDKNSKIFSLFLLALVLWQLGDMFVRMSDTSQDAVFWTCVFSISWIFVMPLGLHFCFFFCGHKKIAESLTFHILIYAPAITFLVLSLMNKEEYFYLHSSFWGWISDTRSSDLLFAEENWISAQGVFMAVFLFYNVFKLPRGDKKREQTLLIASGFSIPLLQGIITEIILPHAFNITAIPLVSTSMTCISISILIALKKHNLFSVTESLKTGTILEAMTDILIILSPHKKIFFINSEGERALGVEQMNKHDLKIEDFFVNEDEKNKKFIEDLFERILSGEKIANYSAQLKTKSGKKIYAMISATSYKVGLRESQILLLIHDISQLTQTAHQLAIREEEIRDKSEELNAFFYRTTHDLRGPVSSIISLAKLAKKETDLKVITDCVDRIDTSATRLNNILFDFIKIMRIKENTLDISLIDFQKLIANIIQSASTDKDVVDFKVTVDPEINFYTDENLLDSILYNLVANAVNYRKRDSAEKPFVAIHVIKTEKGIVLKVSDNGTGIKKEIQGKIFNLFFRGTTEVKGTGLGLYILKNAITKLHGEVSLESEIDKGTTFTVSLPDLKSINSTENQLPPGSSVS